MVTDSLFTNTTNTFENTRDLFDEVFWARINAGFHFHHSLVNGGEQGQEVSEQLLSNYFQRLDD